MYEEAEKRKRQAEIEAQNLKNQRIQEEEEKKKKEEEEKCISLQLRMEGVQLLMD